MRPRVFSEYFILLIFDTTSFTRRYITEKTIYKLKKNLLIDSSTLFSLNIYKL